MKLHPAVVFAGLLGSLALIFCLVMVKIVRDNRPKPKTPHQLYVEDRYRRLMDEKAKQREPEEMQDDGEIRGPMDNRGYSDE